MIAHIVGAVLSIDANLITLTPRGSGISYDIYSSPLAIAEASRVGISGECEIWIYHHITEMSQTLFGFGSLEEKKIFLTLLRVSGIGAKTALSILSLGVDGIIQAIESGDDKTLSSVPGLGKKGALKIILELKGSLDIDAVGKGSKGHASPPRAKVAYDEARDALLSLGYIRSDLDHVLSTLDPHLSSDEMIRQVIKQLSIKTK